MTGAALTQADGATPEELHPRHVAIRVAEVAVVIAFVVIAIGALPGLDEVRARLSHASPAWVVALVLAEAGSCVGYLLVFRSTFCPRMSWRLSWDIAMSEQAANSLLPAGGAGGLALGVWALRQSGMPVGHIGRRTVAFFVVTSAANFVTLVVVGFGVFAGVLPGHGSALLTLVPALVTALGVVLIVLSPRLLRALGTRGSQSVAPGWRGRASIELRRLLTAGADGVEQALILIRSRGLGAIVGSFAYMGFDIVALGCGFAAVGHVPAFGILVLGYLIGQLGNLIPLPGGVGGTEGALIGIFALYGANLTDATAAVLIYRLIQLVIPAALGAPAFVLLRRRLMRSDQPATVCAPLGDDGLPVFDLSGRMVT
jgi:uncharacterized protein (TIRG00374 family)